ncbi:MAG: molybdate ABC transporter permease subunit [Cyanobacteria bacterium P01_D01_bin.6]
MPADLSPLWISLKTASVATVLAAVAGIAIAYWMSGYRGRGRGWIDGILTLPLVLPPTVVGFLLLLLMGKNSPLGQLLDRLGITLIFTWTAAVIAATVVALPLVYRTVLSAFAQVDLTLMSSARTLGAGEWRIFWQILLPLAWPGVLAGIILAFARALGEFGATLMVGGSIPGVTQTMPIAIFFAAEAGRLDIALLWVLCIVAICLLVIAGINYGTPPRRVTQGRPPALIKPLFNYLYFSHPAPRFHHCPQPVGALGGASPRRDNRTAMPPQFAAHIETPLSEFPLQVSFQAGQSPLGLLGASGSGKSMTIRCIAGLETPARGHIRFNDRILFDAQTGINVPCRDRHVGLVFQNYALFPHLTVAQNIAFGMTSVPKAKRIVEVAHYLDRIGLTGMGERYPYQLSGGQQQRVALARAIAAQPDILLLDEPLAALDTYLRSQIEKLLREILSNYDGVTLFITHKLEEAYRLCADLLVLSQGQIVAQGTKEDIFTRPPTYEVAKVTECKNFSRARPLDATHIESVDWDCQLEVIDPIPPRLTYLGIRAHHIRFPRKADQLNTFPGWIASISETQHRVSLLIKLHNPPTAPHDYHLQAEVYREKWELLQNRSFPWNVRLDPVHLIMMTE